MFIDIKFPKREADMTGKRSNKNQFFPVYLDLLLYCRRLEFLVQ